MAELDNDKLKLESMLGCSISRTAGVQIPIDNNLPIHFPQSTIHYELYKNHVEFHIEGSNYNELGRFLKRTLPNDDISETVERSFCKYAYILKRRIEGWKDIVELVLEMRKQTIQMRNAILNINIEGNDIEAVGKWFLGYEYPKNHPIQTYRAKAIWCVLNGTWDDYIPLYSDGVDGGFRLCGDEEPPSEIQFLYYEEDLDNWNEGLDREMTKDMHLTRVFHNLYDHMEFSIFDLLWVRDFNIEVSVEVDFSSYPTGYEYEDIDPHRDYSKILNNE